MSKKILVGVIGAGTMGTGITQVAAQAGHSVQVYDANDSARDSVVTRLESTLAPLVTKGKFSKKEAASLCSRVQIVKSLEEMSKVGLVIEAIAEKLELKTELLSRLESIVSSDCLLATNTSSLSITSIAAGCEHASRVIGIHFFNPAPILPLVEIVSALQTDSSVVEKAKALISSWGKTCVEATDSPGFIVNKIARPFYGEALRIYEEQIADPATIDWAMKTIGGFKMGPFELMDLIGIDINFAVSQNVFAGFSFDSRYTPSLTQKRLVDAQYLGRKTSRGFYDYKKGAESPQATEDKSLGKEIVERIVAMLINEAFDTEHYGIASREDIETAMTKGVNYPKGLFAWAEETGYNSVITTLTELQEYYGEPRYRPSVGLKQEMLKKRRSIHSFT